MPSIVVIGPEGGVTDEEQQLLQAIGFDTYTLTPTVLRSVDAVTIALGGIRSIIS